MNALIFAIGKKIRDLRNEKGFTLADIGDKGWCFAKSDQSARKGRY